MTLSPAPQVLYIAGSGRSGSTLVERTLGAIPGWVNVGELIELFRQPHVADELCGCGEPFWECPFWSAVGARAFSAWDADTFAHIRTLIGHVSRQRSIPRLAATHGSGSSDFDRALSELGSTFDRLYAAVAAESGAQVIVDASKWPGHAVALQRTLGARISLLHLVRDSRGVAYSTAKSAVPRPQARDHQAHEQAVMVSRKASSTAARWAAFQSEIGAIRGLFEHSTRVRYEDFIASPLTTTARILQRLHLAEYVVQLDHVHDDRLDLPQSHGIAGNPSRFEHGVVKLRADDAWLTKLPEKDRRIVTAVTAPWLARYGYPLRPEDPTPMPPDPSTVTVWPTVAVVLPTRGRPELLREAVVSVIEQDYQGDIDIVVVHDQEDPHQELKALAGPHRSITLLNNTHAQGLAGARNTGLDYVKGTADYIASCDDDDFWDVPKVTLQMTRMLAEPDLVVLGAGIRLLMGEGSQGHVVEWPGDSPVVTRAQLLRNRRKELHSSTLLVRREVYDQVGGYDETLPSSYAEDYEFLLRAVEVGRIGVVNTPLASIRKYTPSWFRERAEVVAEALEYVLETHPQIKESRAGHARVLGQIAFARSTMGQRRQAVKIAGHAFSRWPVAPHAALALVHATTGIDPRVLLGSVRKAGRGIT